MINGNSHHRRPDPLLLLVAAVLLGAAMTSAAIAGDEFDFFPASDAVYRPTSEDGGFTVASMGHEGGGLNVSLTPPNEPSHGHHSGQRSVQRQETLSQVFLFLSYPW